MDKRQEALRFLIRSGRKIDKAKYPSYLKGLSHTQLNRQRGLRGGTYGPASDVRRIDPKTGQVIEIIKPTKEKPPWD